MPSRNEIECFQQVPNILVEFPLHRNEVLPILQKMSGLREVDLRENPFLSSEVRHWEEVVGACQGLQSVDGKKVDEKCRVTMRNLRKRRGNNNAVAASASKEETGEGGELSKSKM
jgi:hypothetical protein